MIPADDEPLRSLLPEGFVVFCEGGRAGSAPPVAGLLPLAPISFIFNESA